MQSMTCEMCGSNQFTKIDGLFQCDHCSTKYTPEEAKKLIVSGTVEVVKGKSEKDRLINIINTQLKLGNTTEALSVSNKALTEFPESLELYLIKLKILFNTINPIYSYNDILNLNSEKENYYSIFGFELFDCWVSSNNERKSIAYAKEICNTVNAIHKLFPSDKIINNLIADYNARNKTICNLKVSNINSGKELLFSEDLFCNYPRYIPYVLVSYIQRSREFAKNTMQKIAQDKTYLKGLLNYPKQYKKVDVDGYYLPSVINQLLYITPRECVVEGVGYFGDASATIPTIIVLNENNRSIEDMQKSIFEIINEDKNNEIYLSQVEIRCKRIFKGIKNKRRVSELQSIYEQFATKTPYGSPEHVLKPISSYYSLSFFVQSVELNKDKKGIVIKVQYDNMVSKTRTPGLNSTYYMNIPLDMIDNLERHLNISDKSLDICPHCGGQFKGIFSKICSKCGKPKSY